MKLKLRIFALMAMLLCFAFQANAQEIVTELGLQNALSNGGEYVLGDHIEVTEEIQVPAGVTTTLDLNGYAITSGYQSDPTKHIYPFNNYGNFTIKDSNGDGSITGRGIYVQAGSKLTVDGGSIYGIDSNGGSALFQYGGDIVINGGHIEQKAPGTTNFAVNAAGGTVEVKGGWVGGNHGAIAAFNDAVVTIYDGKFVCTGTAGMTDNVLYTSGNGSITINGGTFIGDSDSASGGCCIYDANGKTTVNNGTFKGTSGGDVWGTTGTTINGGTFENLTEIAHVAVGATITNGGKTYTKTADGLEEIDCVAKIGETIYSTFGDALTAAGKMSGDVTVEVYDKVTLNTAFSGSYSSINFVGKDTDAEIYLDVQGYITATGKKVSFKDLTLSKSQGGHITNAGFMNVAFGVYDVVEVAYTNCVFANGAYASSGNVTYTDCTFKKSWDKYGLWAYGDVDVTVDGCEFDDYRGIKMYAEGKAKTTELTVKNTDFSALGGEGSKPAIVLTYGASVVLEKNTYSSTGTLELDLDGDPNGTAVTSDVAPVCVNDNGPCGVLVDGKIYATVAQAAAVATEGSNVTLLYSTDEVVEFAEGVNLTLANGVTADNVTVIVAGLNGEGTEASPFLINNVDDLVWFQKKVDELAADGSTQFAGKYFKLTADINLAGINWNPIGSMDGDHGSFKGVFDGDDHTISNLNVEQNGNGIGLFARTTGNAVIKNLKLNNVTVKSTDNSNYVGGVVGNAYASTKIENVHLSGNIYISGRGYIGGIAGHGYVVMDNVSVVATGDGQGNDKGLVTSTFWCAGGILGYGGEGATNIMNANVENVVVTSAAGGLGAIVGMAEDNNGTQPISGSNLSASNVEIKTYTGAYGDGYSNYALGYLYGGNPTSKLTGEIKVENVGITTSNGVAPIVNDAVASIDGTIYFSLASAVVAADGKTITLLRDVELTETLLIPAGKTIALDLNGKTISQTKECTASYEMICNKGDLTIKGEGKISFKDTSAGDPTYGWGSYTLRNEGTLVVENSTIEHLGEQNSGSVKHMYCAIFQYCGSTTINGGTISTPTYRSVRLWKGDMTINGGTFNGQVWVQAVDNSSNLEINGGTFRPAGVDGSSVFVTNSDYAVEFAVTGGTFNTKIGCSDAASLAGAITGGSFTAAAKDNTNSALIADGCTFGEPDENGLYGIVSAPVAKIGDVEYTSLQAALNAAAAGTGNVTVTILKDVNLTGVTWTPVRVSEPGYPEVTVEGNYKTITGLTDMLFSGTWAGNSGLIIKNLTIANSTIVNDKDEAKGNVGVGAFIGFPQASATITLENCHLKNSSVEGGHWTGGLIGYAAGYAGPDGPVFMNLTIKGCSVTGSTITGKGSAGGVIGHGSGNGWTNVVIEGTTVSGNTITSTGSSNNKAGAVMGTIGAAGQPTTANGVTKTGGASVSATVANNTVTSNGTAITTIYGRQGTPTGLLYVAGGSYDKYPIEQGVSYAAPIEGYEIVENTNGTYGLDVKLPEVEITDIKGSLTDSDPDLTFALNFTIKDLEDLDEKYLEKVMEKYGNWYTDYVLTISGLTDENVTFNSDGSGDGYLAGQYDGFGSNWVSVPFEDVTLANNESIYIMEYAATLMGQSGLRYTLAEIVSIVMDFDCGVYFSPEFLTANPGLQVDLHLKVFTEDAEGNKVNDINVATNNFDIADYVAIVHADGKQTTYCTNLADAVAAADGKTITLLRDVELTETLTIPADKTIALDLNGKTVSMADASGATAALIKNNGNLTITDGTEGEAGKLSFNSTTPSANNGYACNTISNYGTITIEAGTIENTTVGGACYALDNYAGSTATINGGKLTAEKTAVRIFNWTDGDAAKATLNVNGGEIYSKDGYAINVNSGNAPAVALNITGGIITTDDTDYNLAVYVVNKGTAENFTASVTGGTFNGYYALNGITSATMAEGAVSITDGTFEGVICYDEPAYGFISGGTYSNDVNDFCAYGYVCEANENGTYGVVARESFELVEGVAYTNNKDFEDVTVKYSRTLSNVGKWYALYLPVEIPVSFFLDNGYSIAEYNTMHCYDENEDDVIDRMTMEVKHITDAAATLTANYPYFIRANSAEAQTLEIELTNTTLYAATSYKLESYDTEYNYTLTGTYEPVASTGDQTRYALYANGVWDIMSGTLKPFRHYLTITDSKGSDVILSNEALKAMRIVARGEEGFEGTTGVETVETPSTGDDVIYDLSGRRIEEPVKGSIYIINGEKVVY